jgi:uncharacterized repeat protein (TIGR01451 family)
VGYSIKGNSQTCTQSCVFFTVLTLNNTGDVIKKFFDNIGWGAWANSATYLKNGNLVACGTVYQNTAAANARIPKVAVFDSLGFNLWQSDYNYGIIGNTLYDVEHDGVGNFLTLGGGYVTSLPYQPLIIEKRTLNGPRLWNKEYRYNSDKISNGYAIKRTLLNNFFVAGSKHALSELQDGDGWIFKMDSEGNVISSSLFGSDGIESFRSIALVDDRRLVAIGPTSSNSGQVQGNHGATDFWLVYVVEDYNTIKGSLFIDIDNNGIKDTDEPYFSSGFGKSYKGADSVKTGIIDGRFTNIVDTGTYQTSIALTAFKNYYTITPVSKQTLFTSYGKRDSVGFAAVPIASINDLSIVALLQNFTRIGRTSSYQIRYRNDGTVIQNGQVRVVKDNRISFESANPVPQTIIGDTLIWNFSNLSVQQESLIQLNLKLPVTGITIGDTIKTIAAITPVLGDATTFDNFSNINNQVVGAYDPNDKTENHGGLVSPQQINDKEYLTYTIRFQNVGNDTAFKVVIKDPLSNKLDPSSIKLVAASHPYQLSVYGENKLECTFDNINLPDSGTNSTASNGFITFQIRPKPSLAVGDSVSNSAYIYFDYNAPVNTNKQTTYIKYPAPPLPVASGLLNTYCNNSGVQKGTIINMPPPCYGSNSISKT